MLKNSFLLIVTLFLFANWRSGEITKRRILISSFERNHIHIKRGVNLKKYSLSDELLNIRIFSQLKVQEFTVSPESGTYGIWANGNEITSTLKTPLIKISFINDSIEVKTFETIIGRYKKIKLASPDFIKSFRLKLISPERKPRFYEDNLTVEVEAGNLKSFNIGRLKVGLFA